MGGWDWGDAPQSSAQRLASENIYRQIRRVIEMVRETLVGTRAVKPTAKLICELHGIAMNGLLEGAGTLRQAEVVITRSRHAPPTWSEVPQLVEELCDYCDSSTRDAIHAAAYVLWRLNWIHPFAPDGNGRTARAVAMFVLFARLRAAPVARPGRLTFLELLGHHKLACQDALEAADAACRRGQIDVTRLEQLLLEVLGQSLTRQGAPPA